MTLCELTGRLAAVTGWLQAELEGLWPAAVAVLMTHLPTTQHMYRLNNIKLLGIHEAIVSTQHFDGCSSA